MGMMEVDSARRCEMERGKSWSGHGGARPGMEPSRAGAGHAQEGKVESQSSGCRSRAEAHSSVLGVVEQRLGVEARGSCGEGGARQASWREVEGARWMLARRAAARTVRGRADQSCAPGPVGWRSRKDGEDRRSPSRRAATSAGRSRADRGGAQ